MKLAILIMSLGLTTACTNHLYQGKTIYEDNGKTCEASIGIALHIFLIQRVRSAQW